MLKTQAQTAVQADAAQCAILEELNNSMKEVMDGYGYTTGFKEAPDLAAVRGGFPSLPLKEEPDTPATRIGRNAGRAMKFKIGNKVFDMVILKLIYRIEYIMCSLISMDDFKKIHETMTPDQKESFLNGHQSPDTFFASLHSFCKARDKECKEGEKYLKTFNFSSPESVLHTQLPATEFNKVSKTQDFKILIGPFIGINTFVPPILRPAATRDVTETLKVACRYEPFVGKPPSCVSASDLGESLINPRKPGTIIGLKITESTLGPFMQILIDTHGNTDSEDSQLIAYLAGLRLKFSKSEMPLKDCLRDLTDEAQDFRVAQAREKILKAHGIDTHCSLGILDKLTLEYSFFKGVILFYSSLSGIFDNYLYPFDDPQPPTAEMLGNHSLFYEKVTTVFGLKPKENAQSNDPRQFCDREKKMEAIAKKFIASFMCLNDQKDSRLSFSRAYFKHYLLFCIDPYVRALFTAPPVFDFLCFMLAKAEHGKLQLKKCGDTQYFQILIDLLDSGTAAESKGEYFDLWRKIFESYLSGMARFWDDGLWKVPVPLQRELYNFLDKQPQSRKRVAVVAGEDSD